MKLSQPQATLLRLTMAAAVALTFAACDRKGATTPTPTTGSMGASSAPEAMSPPATPPAATGTAPMPGASAASN